MAAHPETSRRGAFSHDVEQRQRMATGTAPADSAGGSPPLISIEYRVQARPAPCRRTVELPNCTRAWRTALTMPRAKNWRRRYRPGSQQIQDNWPDNHRLLGSESAGLTSDA